MKVKIYVTEDDISSGRKYSLYDNPIAKAINKVLKHRVACTTNYELTLVGTTISIYFPDRVKNFNKLFDDDRWENSLKPFSFVLDIPDKYLSAAYTN